MVRDARDSAVAAFDGSLEPSCFYIASPQEEALARLEWLLVHRQRMGVVLGGSGYGKSHLAAMAVRRMGGLGAEVALLSLRGLGADDWLELLLDRLPLDPRSAAEPLRPWQKLENRLRENTLMERSTVLVFDDLDHACADAMAGIERLVSAAEPRFARLVVVGTLTADAIGDLPRSLVSRAALRIELAPWTETETTEFLTWAIARSGGGDRFSSAAAVTLARLTGGIPRQICQLARLSLVAAQAEGLTVLDAATVERVWRELVPRATDRAASIVESPNDETPRANQRVRAVRRLWG